MSAGLRSRVAVEALEFPDLAELRCVSSVPHVVVNGRASFTESLQEDDFVMRVVDLAQPYRREAA